jgi:hypothetical protein
MSAASLPLLLAFLLPSAPAGAQDEATWPVNETPHFVIHHQRPGAALGDYSKIEQIYGVLRTELWTLVPWMTTEKTNVYIYQDVDAYRRGRFHPPAWSGGLMSPSEKALAVFEPIDTGVIAHELTHLYFHTFFDDQKAPPPPWLDEGLASMLQAQGLGALDPRLKGPVLSATMPLELFLKTRPGADSPGGWVNGWYQESQSLVWFLKRGHIESSFVDFCGKLRDGKDAETALRESYGYADVAAFDADWQKWRPRKAVGQFNGP